MLCVLAVDENHECDAIIGKITKDRCETRLRAAVRNVTAPVERRDSPPESVPRRPAFTRLLWRPHELQRRRPKQLRQARGEPDQILGRGDETASWPAPARVEVRCISHDPIAAEHVSTRTVGDDRLCIIELCRRHAERREHGFTQELRKWRAGGAFCGERRENEPIARIEIPGAGLVDERIVRECAERIEQTAVAASAVCLGSVAVRADTAEMAQQLPQRDRPGLFGKLRHVRPHVGIEVEPFALDQKQDRRGRDGLGNRSGAEDCCGSRPRAVFQIGDAPRLCPDGVFSQREGDRHGRQFLDVHFRGHEPFDFGLRLLTETQPRLCMQQWRCGKREKRPAEHPCLSDARPDQRISEKGSGRSIDALMLETISASLTPGCELSFFHSGLDPNAPQIFSRAARLSKPTM